jgi:hypothetical protein
MRELAPVSRIFSGFLGLVPGGGVEPPRAEARRILSPLRLPVPPSRLGLAEASTLEAIPQCKPDSASVMAISVSHSGSEAANCGLRLRGKLLFGPRLRLRTVPGCQPDFARRRRSSRPSRDISFSRDYFGRCHFCLVEDYQVVAYHCTFSAYDQAHSDALGFVVVSLVKQVDGAQTSTESEGRANSFSGGASGDERAH